MNRTQTIKFKLSTILLALNFVIVASVISFVSPQIVRAAPRPPVPPASARFVFVENGDTLIFPDLITVGQPSARIPIEGLNGEKIKAIGHDDNGLFAPATFIGVGDKGGIFRIDNDFKAVLKGRIPLSLLGVPLDIDHDPNTGKLFVVNDKGEVIEFDPKNPNSFDIGKLRYGPGDANEGKPAKGVLAFNGQTPFLLDVLNNVLAQITDLRFLKLQTVAKANLNNSFPLGFDFDSLTGKGYISLLAPGQTIPDLHEINPATGQTSKIGSLGAPVEGLAVQPQIPKDFHCVVTPPLATNRVGTNHKMSVAAYDGDKLLESGSFTIISHNVRGSNGGSQIASIAGDFFYRGDNPGADTIEFEVQHVDGRTATCTATKEWVNTPYIDDVIKDGKKLNINGHFATRIPNMILVRGIPQATKTLSEIELLSKNGGKKVEEGTEITVVSGGDESNKFLFGLTVPDLACVMTPLIATNELGESHLVKIEVFARGRLVGQFGNSSLHIFGTKVISGPNTGTLLSPLISDILFAGLYRGEKEGFDVIEASGTFQGKVFSCRAFKRWVKAQ
jgi:uncharacterized protein DUF4394